MELSFDDAVIAEGKTNNYMEVGNHKVKTIKVEKGLSSQKQSPYVEITVANEAEQTCAQKYYINGGAWNISKSAILTIVAAANNCDQETAKTKLAGLTGENIDTKLSTLLMNKPFGITINGEWVNPTDTSKPSFVKGVFGSYLFAVPVDKMDKLSKKPYIKGENMSVPKEEGKAIVSADANKW